MVLIKKEKSNTGKVIATVVGGAVAAGVTYLATKKKGKAMAKDASDSVSSMLGKAERKGRVVRKKILKTAAKASDAVQKARVSVRKASEAAEKDKRVIKKTVRAAVKRKA